MDMQFFATDFLDDCFVEKQYALAIEVIKVKHELLKVLEPAQKIEFIKQLHIYNENDLALEVISQEPDLCKLTLKKS